VAIASVNALPIDPIRTRVQHVNVQVATLDEMVASYQRVKQLGFDMALSVGQHTNDKELSYYAVTPSGFEWEVGWNPIVVDESTWKPTTHQGISIWGHTPEGQTVIDKLDQFAIAARSLLRHEDTVAALSSPAIADYTAADYPAAA
jgi:Glyoxalase/Bleomycin resistance protein/Dioxygenase superfamily